MHLFSIHALESPASAHTLHGHLSSEIAHEKLKIKVTV